MRSLDTETKRDLLETGRCPACGAGIRPTPEGYFRCPACGLGRAPIKTETAIVSPGAGSPGPDLSYLTPDARVLVRAPSPVANRGDIQKADYGRPGTPLPDADGAPFDAMILIRHLEQSHDPVAEMAALRRLLSPGRLLYLEIAQTDAPWHIPIQAARRLIENAGFKVVRRVGRFSLNRHAPLRLWCRRY